MIDLNNKNSDLCIIKEGKAAGHFQMNPVDIFSKVNFSFTAFQFGCEMEYSTPLFFFSTQIANMSLFESADNSGIKSPSKEKTE